ncbi:hypothetical protein F8271_24995 [Micromonospora sp. ALFpr18c]|uniref:hypothetical protein n=1 Tax=Micromonospora sp. ALFpr18c TaxID=1458665 RepID=UPI00124AE456|nr:hypothetical protein [Micromonospora sp. ALFpr18c]KAB1932928.1 hypothetical protein F8271_24995 [Micromonospora sp. ALFpr18c]
MTPEQALRVLRLQTAVNQMAARYGMACMAIAYAEGGSDEHTAAHRAAARQYRALMRLTETLTRHALGETR